MPDDAIAKKKWQELLYPIGKYGIVGVLLLTALLHLFQEQWQSVVLKTIWIALPIPFPLSLYYWLIYNRTENWIGAPALSLVWDSHIALTRLFQILGINFQWLLSLCILLTLIRICSAKVFVRHFFLLCRQKR